MFSCMDTYPAAIIATKDIVIIILEIRFYSVHTPYYTPVGIPLSNLLSDISVVWMLIKPFE